MDFAVSKQSFLLSYLDGFKLISIFFLAAIPIMFLLKTNKIDQATRQKISEESH
jgi:DHA2 family multidrug resistance protein